MITAMDPCPCGSGKAFSACCERYISGREPAPTAEALMRARYSSYATGRIDFIEKTHSASTRAEGFNRESAEKWARESEWKGLHIMATKGGGERDNEGAVSFVAVFAHGGQEQHHEEIATFRKEAGVWMFVDGDTPRRETFVKTGPDIGRNDPCHCGSKKKFKKCHGREA